MYVDEKSFKSIKKRGGGGENTHSLYIHSLTEKGQFGWQKVQYEGNRIEIIQG